MYHYGNSRRSAPRGNSFSRGHVEWGIAYKSVAATHRSRVFASQREPQRTQCTRASAWPPRTLASGARERAPRAPDASRSTRPRRILVACARTCGPWCVACTEYINRENRLAARGDLQPHRCCEDRCSRRIAERRDLNYTLRTEWAMMRDGRVNFVTRVNRLLYAVAYDDRPPLPPPPSLPATISGACRESIPCMVCCRAYRDCVCYCRRVILPAAATAVPPPQQSVGARENAPPTTTHHPRVRGVLAGNIVARMYTFWDTMLVYYTPVFMVHLARLGFMLTDFNCIRCTECLFLVSFWDVLCLFHYSGIARNGPWHERLLRHLYAKWDLADIVHRVDILHKRAELTAGLRTLTVWHAQLHPTCSNIAHTERYVNLMFARRTRYGGVASIPRFLAARQLGYYER